MSGNVHEAKLVERREIAAHIQRLSFVVDGPSLTFRPGQFVSIRVGEEPGGALVLRSYSIASSPGAERFSIVLKVLSAGVGSRFLAELPVGDSVRITGPMGFFVCELAHAGDVVFGVTGVGIAPVLPMLEEVLARKESGKVHLLWGSRHTTEVFWLAELTELSRVHARFSYELYLSGPGEQLAGGDEQLVGARAGRISAPLLALASSLTAPTFYLVGSGAMVREVKNGLVAAGFDRKRQIRNEVFFER